MSQSTMTRSAVIATAMLIIAPASARTVLPMNVPTSVDGVTSVCTGIGADEEHNPAWNAYPLKIVLAGKQGQYLADADVTVSQGGRTVAGLHCDAPWILLKLAPGRYRVTASRDGRIVAGTAYAPATGQGRAILRFPREGGAVSAKYLESPG